MEMRRAPQDVRRYGTFAMLVGLALVAVIGMTSRTAAYAQEQEAEAAVITQCACCNAEVPEASQVGERCPHCGALWGFSRKLTLPKKGPVVRLEHYPEPERNWIASGIWRLVGNEYDRKYHLPSCPILAKQDARLLLGWRSVHEAQNAGRQPCPTCKAPDPTKTPHGQMRQLLEKSASALRLAQQVGQLGFISQAADYNQVGWIARGDAFMIAADEEKKRGRLDNARSLYREAGNAYGQALVYLPPVPGPGATLAETSGMSLPSSGGGMSAMSMATGGGYSMGNLSISGGAMGGVVTGF